MHAIPSLVTGKMVQVKIPEIDSVPSDIDIDTHMDYVVWSAMDGLNKFNSSLTMKPSQKGEFIREMYWQIVGLEPGLMPQLTVIQGTLDDESGDSQAEE